MLINKLIIYFLNDNREYKFKYLQAIFIIKNSVYNKAFIKYNISKLIFFIDDYLTYFIIFVIYFIDFKYLIINKIINNNNVEFNIIEI